MPELKQLAEDLVWSEDPIVMFDPGFGPLPPEYDFHECIAGVKTFYISANGNVYPCTSLLNERFVVGNLRQRKLSDLWNDRAMTKIASLPRDKITGHCRQCEYFKNCRGACRGITYAHTGDLFSSYPNCLSKVKAAVPVSARKI